MRISELRQREDFDRILRETLSAGWAARYGHAVEVAAAARGGAQQWREQSLLSAFHGPAPGAEVRRYLRDAIRFTPVARRAIPQAVFGQLATSRLGLRLGARPGFGVTPPLPRAASLLVVPGNQRIRVFDFAAGTVRSLLKVGFEPITLEQEMAIRGGPTPGPFLPIEAAGTEPLAFDEPIVDGYALPRCPPWLDRRGLEREAKRQLMGWLDKTAITVDSTTYTKELRTAASAHLERLAFLLGSQRFRLGGYVERLARAAAQLGTIELAQTHGDFQPGNVLVSRRGDRVWLIDWEHSRLRSRTYDLLVWELRTRSGAGLAKRLADLGRGRRLQWTSGSARRLELRELALFLLEDLNWFLRESTLGPYRIVSQGLSHYARELARLDGALGRLLGHG